MDCVRIKNNLDHGPYFERWFHFPAYMTTKTTCKWKTLAQNIFFASTCNYLFFNPSPPSQQKWKRNWILRCLLNKKTKNKTKLQRHWMQLGSQKTLLLRTKNFGLLLHAENSLMWNNRSPEQDWCAAFSKESIVPIVQCLFPCFHPAKRKHDAKIGFCPRKLHECRSFLREVNSGKVLFSFHWNYAERFAITLQANIHLENSPDSENLQVRWTVCCRAPLRSLGPAPGPIPIHSPPICTNQALLWHLPRNSVHRFE